MKKIKIKNNENAITLIALVVTIIILLILAGVTIGVATNGTGLFEKANSAKERQNYVTAKETLSMKLLDIQIGCVANGEEFSLKKISEVLEDSEESIIILDKYYAGISKLSSTANSEPAVIKGIVVYVNNYEQYKFLIGNKDTEPNIIGVTKDITTTSWNIGDLPDGFLETQEFEKNEFGMEVSKKHTETVVINSSYTESEKIKTINLSAGTYRVECWGAQGGSINETYHGGYGAYTSGKLVLNQDKTFYAYIGSAGQYTGQNNSVIPGGYNGGGNSSDCRYNDVRLSTSGGGSTDLRLTNGDWDNDSSLNSRIIVAAGGSGPAKYGDYYISTGVGGGGILGYDGKIYEAKSGHEGKKASQTSGGIGGSNNSTYSGSFGKGGSGKSSNNDWIAGGGRKWILWRWSRRRLWIFWWKWIFIYFWT